MKKNFTLSIIAILTSFILTSCGMQNAPQEKMDYEETKKMVVDILKTDEGKKALQEVLKDEEMQQNLILDQKIVQETLQNSFSSEEGKKLIEKVFEDPKFVKKYAKNLESAHQELLKSLMKDPDYQKMLLDIFQDPEMQKTIQTSIKSQEFRKHLQDVVNDIISSPLYKAKIEEALLKAAEEYSKQNGQSGGESGGGDKTNQEGAGN